MKSFILLFAVFSVSTYSLARSFDGPGREVQYAKPENGLYSDSMNESKPSGQNPKNKKRSGSSRSQKKSKEKRSINDSKGNTTKRSLKKRSSRSISRGTVPKRNSSSEKGVSLWADVFGGYSNFRCDNVSPKLGIGFGTDIGLQFDYNRLWDKIPNGFFGETTIGYSYRGSGAYHIHYVGARVLPIGYKYSINSDLSIVGKAGMYVAFPLSKIKVRSHSYDTSMDYGLSVGLGVEWKRFGLMATYEHGFADVKKGGGVKLYNQGAFLTLSYRIRTF